MPTFAQPRIVLALTLAFALVAPARAQNTAGIHPEVLKFADETRVKVTASAFSQPIKDVLLADVTKALNPKFSTNSQFSDLDRVKTYMMNSQIALEHLDAFLKTIEQDQLLTPKLKKLFLDKANDGRTSLPHGYNDMMRNTTFWRDQYENYPRVIKRFNDFRRDVAASPKAPPALKAKTDASLAASLDMMGDAGTALSWSTSLDDQQSRYNNYIYIIDDVVTFENTVRSEAYPNWPAFVTNTIKEAEDIRVNVGNPSWNLGRPHLDGLQKSYRERRIVMRNAIEIPQAMKRSPRGFEDIAILRKVDEIMAINIQYHATHFDPHGIEDILDQIKRRK